MTKAERALRAQLQRDMQATRETLESAQRCWNNGDYYECAVRLEGCAPTYEAPFMAAVRRMTVGTDNALRNHD